MDQSRKICTMGPAKITKVKVWLMENKVAEHVPGQKRKRGVSVVQLISDLENTWKMHVTFSEMSRVRQRAIFCSGIRIPIHWSNFLPYVCGMETVPPTAVPILSIFFVS